MLILDASAIIGWIMPDEAGIDLEPLIARGEPLLAPWLIWVELRNILIVSERRGRLPAGMGDQIADAVDALQIQLDSSASSAVVMDLARRHGLTAYDALYLETALRHGAMLATLDGKLRAAAVAEAVALAG
ncbi:type II toxin-antitoxin system VapC family toxin [Paracoccus panacisoli]|uniref:Ribonuclease VapC n=1 Tax=Paracoccus panacisoli TaxID=1510163 RepID=A0ABV6T8K9_9RHOB